VNNSSNCYQAAIDITKKAQRVGEILGEIIELFAEESRQNTRQRPPATS